MENGGYTWAKYGFRMQKDSAFKYAQNEIKSHRDEAQRIVSDYFKKNPTSHRFPMYMLARQPWGREAMAGTSWLGTINLSNPVERRDFYDYVGYKAKR